jgi:DNA-binding MarR family transcriptional regulator
VDFVERLREQWQARLPDVDTAPSDVVVRILRIASLLSGRHAEGLARHGLVPGEFEVLAALRRADRPLRAREITTVTESPPASIAKRVAHLHAAGLVERGVPERDRRGVLVWLTDAGRALVDEVFPQQVEREREALTDLSGEQAAELARLLAVMLRALDRPGH